MIRAQHLLDRPCPPSPIACERHGSFHILEIDGRWHALPILTPPPDNEVFSARPTCPPDLLSATTRPELIALIDAWQQENADPLTIGTLPGYRLVRYRGQVHAVPRQADAELDLDDLEKRRDAGVVSGVTVEELRARLTALAQLVPVEFTGWLPIFKEFGNCGRHPQFTHTDQPPGYRFVHSTPPQRKPLAERLCEWLGDAAELIGYAVRPMVGFFRGAADAPVARLRVLAAILRLFARCMLAGASPLPLLRFLRARHFQSQILLPPPPQLLFLTSVPYTFDQQPWLIEIEDPTTLFYPHLVNGETADLDMPRFAYFQIVKTLLESDRCRGILTHVRSSAALLPTMFRSEHIRRKTFYAPLGVAVPEHFQDHADDEHLNLLFTCSWHQNAQSFFLRGGLDVLEAFAILHHKYPHLRLTLRTKLPRLDRRYLRIIDRCWVRVVSHFVHEEDMARLFADAHVFLLPAARIHVVSILQAMAHGLVVVASDGWGIEEYVEHDRNGLVVRGRYGKASWVDERAGMLREDYTVMYTPDPEVVRGLVAAISRLVEDRTLRRRIGRTARQDVETRYNLDLWNQALADLFDRVRRR